MMAEVAFESPEEVTEKLSRYEDVFKHRYTERDDGFRMAMQRSSRWYQVPSMSPWPPRRPFNHRRRYQDWDSSHRYGYRSRERGRPPYYARPRYYDESRDRGYQRRYRSRSPYDRRSPRDMSRDPGYRERSRSPYHHQHRGYHNTPSPPPPPPPPPPHHDYTQRSRSRSPHWDRSPRREKPSPGRRETSPPAGWGEPPSPVKKEKNEGSISDDNPPGVSESNEPEKPEPQTDPLMDLSFRDSDQKVVPSESDVLDILSSAHACANEITSQNLKKAQKEGQVQATRKESGRKKATTAGVVQPTLPERDSLSDREELVVPSVHPSSNLMVSHGTTENVLTSLFGQTVEAPAAQPSGKGHKAQKRKKAKKRPKIVISDEESGDIERLIPAEHLTWDSSGNTTAVISNTISDIYKETESLILHVDKKFCSQLSHQASDGSVATSLDTGTVFLDVGGTHDTSSISFDTAGASIDTTLTAACNDPSFGELISKSAGHSRSSSPVNVEEVVREKKSKKKKKKMKRAMEETGKQLKLKIAIGRPDDMIY